MTETAKNFFYRYFKSDAGESVDLKDESYAGYFNSALEWEELLLAHISIPLTTFSPGMIAVLRGLWRGRNIAEREKAQKDAEK